MFFILIVVNCPALSPPENGRISSNDTEYQTNVTYSCNEGFELSATETMKTCQASKTWSSAEEVACNSELHFINWFYSRK